MNNFISMLFESQFIYVLGVLDVVILLLFGLGYLVGKLGSVLLNRAVTFRQGLTFIFLILISVILIVFGFQLTNMLF
ncbi:hypothetical protein [Metabacillus idriensis]|uniref:hypothetical protein n=1 Tax=Metabacillus idriensis TaxID=324768 RepID=UPI0017494C5A|nr:hypothetical protein [Metabacillus idriensis]